MARKQTTTEVIEVVGSDIETSLDGFSEDEIRALYDKSVMEEEEKGRKTQTGMEYITTIKQVMRVLNTNEIKSARVANMIYNGKQMKENKNAELEGREPVKFDEKKIAMSLNHFLNNNGIAKQHFIITEGKNKMITLKE